LLVFCLNDLSVGDIGLFMSPTITVLESIYALRAIRVFLMWMDIPVFDEYLLRILLYEKSFKYLL
jgi:hypothetical protein